jgi:hypothetical protein
VRHGTFSVWLQLTAGLTLGAMYAFSSAVVGTSQNELSITYLLPPTPITLHEPVVWRLQAHNVSKLTAQLDLGKNREENFIITYTGPNDPVPKTIRRHKEGFGITGTIAVAPNSTFEQELLLNKWVVFSDPGRYDIELKLLRGATQGADSIEISSFKASVEILPRDPKRLAEICNSLVARVEKANSYEQAAEAALELRFVADPVAVPYLQRALYAKKLVEPLAIEGLEQIANEEATQALIDALSRTPPETSVIARSALERIESGTHDTKTKLLIQQALKSDRTS